MPGPFLIQRHLLRRGFLCWVLARAAFAMALLLTMSPPLARGGLVGVGVIVLATALGLLEVQRVQERVLLANLGVSLLTLLTMLAAASVLGESALLLWKP